MKRFFFLLLFFTIIPNSFLFGHGFGQNTLVKNSGRGWYSIRTICELCTEKKFLIPSYDFKIDNHRSQRVISGGISKTNCHMKLGFEKGSDITCTPSQAFYLADQQKWINACQLKIGDLLLGKDNTIIPITRIEFIKKPLTVYSIEVKEFHTYFVGNQSILTHNMVFPLALTAGLSVAFGSGAAAGGSAGSFFGPITLVGGIVIGGILGVTGYYIFGGSKINRYTLSYDIAAVNGYFNCNDFDESEKSNTGSFGSVGLGGLGPEEPEDENKKRDTRANNELVREIRKLSKNLFEHKEKLEKYINNPDKYDNRGFLRRATSLQQRTNIIQGRIGHLKTEINNFQNLINKAIKELVLRGVLWK